MSGGVDASVLVDYAIGEDGRYGLGYGKSDWAHRLLTDLQRKIRGWTGDLEWDDCIDLVRAGVEDWGLNSVEGYFGAGWELLAVERDNFSRGYGSGGIGNWRRGIHGAKELKPGNGGEVDLRRGCCGAAGWIERFVGAGRYEKVHDASCS